LILLGLEVVTRRNKKMRATKKEISMKRETQTITIRRIGEIGIDSGMLLLIDPSYLVPGNHEEHRKKYFDLASPQFFKQLCADLGGKQYSQISDRTAYFERGEGGPAVVAAGHGGDGVFPVYAECDQHGFILRLIVDYTSNAIFDSE
jgi:hypothetical protein